ncbi:integrase family protein [Methylobacterium sp. GXF4]|uniref:tyrosine-type recombinase/integrase n=1 Tax=Methylobacterium sp. GXF4 TaxID=1096546 RepID=UPI0002697CC5|nr:tyrosine-type recombinase/integrase [Methylobacterium sp. GXF4]EIZ83626.1 integrase family protein [Methylobacterium sp. GXF4]
MPRSSSSDRRFLEQHRGKWRVTLAVPRDLHSKLGTRLKRQLQTDSLTIANQLKWQVVTEMKAEIEEARGGPSRPVSRSDLLTREALVIAAQRTQAQTHEEIEALDAAIEGRTDTIIGRPIGETREHGGDAEPVYDPRREVEAARYRSLAMGEATPVDLHHAQFVANAGTKARTQGDDHRAVRFLLTWCERNRVASTVEAINKKVVVRFVDDLPEIAGVESPTTLKKYLNRLSLYWRYLEAREIAASDPWHRSHKLLPTVVKGPEERSFTDAEVGKLLAGTTSPQMHDLMRLGALTGARLDAIVDLKVKDCADGLFTFKPQKKETKPRAVPIHPTLAEIVARRTAGRAPDDDLFPEWPAPAANSQRERSFKASNSFTTYRRAVGVDEVIAGKRRSLVNFHSFRRWFITKAEQAGQPEHIIASVVGHKRTGMTLGRYSAGPLISQARACVEAVKLPLAAEVKGLPSHT